MKTIATLACRNNSRRLYAKPLQFLGQNYTVVEYMVRHMQEQPEIDEVILAISETPGNEAFAALAEQMGLRYVLGDDKDVLGRLIKACDLAGGDTVYRVTSESPFTYLEGLEEAVDVHRQHDSDYTMHANLPDGCAFELISLRALKESHSEGQDRHRSELCTLFINENKDRFRINVLEVPPELQRPDYRLTIDYPEDLILCRKIIEHFDGDEHRIGYPAIIEFLDQHPELREIVEGITDQSYVKPHH